MTTKEILLKEIDRLPDADIDRLLAYVHSLGQTTSPKTKIDPSTPGDDEIFWSAYLESESEYHEVYQRLANA
jgi:hypothetical protein